MGIKREDVIWCYRNLLGREAESEPAIQSHMSHDDFRSLIEGFAAGNEFIDLRNKARTAGLSVAVPLPLDLNPLEIEMHASASELAQCAAKIRDAWEFLGNERAHFSVLTDRDFLPTSFEGNKEKFWDSGEYEAARQSKILARHGITDLADRVCVEYGCGVGRITSRLARRFSHVHAYDISKPHLDFARMRAAEVGVGNVDFYQSVDPLNTSIEACDFFSSVIVFQHNPPPIIMALIGRALAALNPGGVALFQVPTYISGYRFKLAEWLATEHQLEMQMHCVPQDCVLQLITESGCRLLEVREDNCAGSIETMISNTFVVLKPA